MRRNLNPLKRKIMSQFPDETWIHERELRANVQADFEDFADSILELMGSGKLRKRGLYPDYEYKRG